MEYFLMHDIFIEHNCFKAWYKKCVLDSYKF